MNKYLIAVWKIGETKEYALLSYTSVKKRINQKNSISGIKVLVPENLKHVIIDNDLWKWKDHECNFYPFIIEDNICIFEAPDDESAKLIYEVGGYE